MLHEMESKFVGSLTETRDRMMKLRLFAHTLFHTVFWVLSCSVFVTKYGVDGAPWTEKEMRIVLERLHIIPDVIPEGPKQFLWVEWLNGIIADYGNTLDPHDCEDRPQLVKWDWKEDKHYALIFVDVDKNKEGVPGEHPYLHWLCVNIEGPEVLEGLNVAKYHPPKPANNTGVHRFAWFVYEQPNGRQYFEFSPIKDKLEKPSKRRGNFSVAEFAKINNIGPVLAANVFLASILRWREMSLSSFARGFEKLAVSIVLEFIVTGAFKPSEPGSVLHTPPEKIKEALEKHEIIPDLLDTAPNNAMQVEWGEGPYANFGNVIDDFGAMREEPFWIEWPGNDEEDRYCLFMLGLDEPSRSNHSLRQWRYWIVVNIEGHNTTVAAGESLADYLPPYPIIDTGMHRYVFLVYKQKLQRFKMFREKRLFADRNDKARGKFSVKRFAKKYNIDGPIAVNFFLCKGKYPLTTTTTTTDPPRIRDPNIPGWADDGPLGGGGMW